MFFDIGSHLIWLSGVCHDYSRFVQPSGVDHKVGADERSTNPEAGYHPHEWDRG